MLLAWIWLFSSTERTTTRGVAMVGAASDLQTELKTLPGNLHHVLASDTLHRHHAEPALLTSLMRKGYDLLGLGHH